MEKITIIGNIGKDAVLKTINGKQYCEFSVAVNKDYISSDGVEVKNTVWYSVLTEKTKVAPYLKQGTKVYVEGRFQTKIYQNKAGEHCVSMNINSPMLELLSAKKEEASNGNDASTHEPTPAMAAAGDDDMLF